MFTRVSSAVFRRGTCRGLAALMLVAGLAQGVSAQQSTIVVRNDMGGSVRERVFNMAVMQLSGQRVQVRGQCMSACTMYLGLGPAMCVTPNAVFGFHGPHMAAGRTDPVAISRATEQMATQYPEPIRSWFLREARHVSGNTVLRVSGAELIRLGAAQAC